MTVEQRDLQQEIISAESASDPSTAQITALVGSVMSGLKPMAEQQAQVQLAHIEASRAKDERAFRFARTTLFISAGILLIVLVLLSGATAFLFAKGSEQAGLQVIWFGIGALGGFGFGRIGKPRQ